MHDGSLDCCGTCWFNSLMRNQDQIKEESQIVYCTIRNFKILNGFSLFCVNHPSYNSNLIDIPVGPVFTNSPYGKTQERKILLQAPDNEKIRIELVRHLNEITEDYEYHKFSETALNEELIMQLSIMKEQRAINGLLKITALNLDTITDLKVQNRAIMLMGLSINALMEISEGEQLPNIEKFISKGLENYRKQDYDQNYDRLATIRYFAVESLRFCSNNKAIELLVTAQNDPNTNIKGLVLEILKEKFKNNKK